MAGNSIDAFLWFEGGRAGASLIAGAPAIVGETMDKEFSGKPAMEIRSYTFDFSQQSEGSEEKTSGQSTKVLPDPVFSPAKITKLVDKASPMLLQALYTGAKYEKAYIHQRKAGGTKGHGGTVFWQIELRRVTIDSLSWSANESGEMQENLTLKYEGLNVKYSPQSLTGAIGEKPVSEADHDLQGPEALKGSKKGARIDDSQVDDVVDRVIAKLKKQSMVVSASSAGPSRYGR